MMIDVWIKFNNQMTSMGIRFEGMDTHGLKTKGYFRFFPKLCTWAQNLGGTFDFSPKLLGEEGF
jgi:hypothetical protein